MDFLTSVILTLVDKKLAKRGPLPAGAVNTMAQPPPAVAAAIAAQMAAMKQASVAAPVESTIEKPVETPAVTGTPTKPSTAPSSGTASPVKPGSGTNTPSKVRIRSFMVLTEVYARQEEEGEEVTR